MVFILVPAYLIINIYLLAMTYPRLVKENVSTEAFEENIHTITVWVNVFGATGAIEFTIVCIGLVYSSWRLIKTMNQGVSANSNVHNLD